MIVRRVRVVVCDFSLMVIVLLVVVVVVGIFELCIQSISVAVWKIIVVQYGCKVDRFEIGINQNLC